MSVGLLSNEMNLLLFIITIFLILLGMWGWSKAYLRNYDSTSVREAKQRTEQK